MPAESKPHSAICERKIIFIPLECFFFSEYCGFASLHLSIRFLIHVIKHLKQVRGSDCVFINVRIQVKSDMGVNHR